jgi:hypothetical protein
MNLNAEKMNQELKNIAKDLPILNCTGKDGIRICRKCQIIMV